MDKAINWRRPTQTGSYLPFAAGPQPSSPLASARLASPRLVSLRPIVINDRRRLGRAKGGRVLLQTVAHLLSSRLVLSLSRPNLAAKWSFWRRRRRLRNEQNSWRNCKGEQRDKKESNRRAASRPLSGVESKEKTISPARANWPANRWRRGRARASVSDVGQIADFVERGVVGNNNCERI